MSFYKEAYRVAGVSYLKYLGIASRCIRNSLKEPYRTDQILRADLYRYSRITFTQKNEMISRVETNYEDAERLRMEQFIEKHKKFLNEKAGITEE